MRATCLRIGNLVDQTDLARDVGISQSTAHRHLQLPRSFLPADPITGPSRGTDKRLIKAPKVYWCARAWRCTRRANSSRAALTSKIWSSTSCWFGAIPRSTTAGAALAGGPRPGDEVDCRDRVEGATAAHRSEVQQPRQGERNRGLQIFQRRSNTGASAARVCCHDGDEVGWIADGILAVPGGACSDACAGRVAGSPREWPPPSPRVDSQATCRLERLARLLVGSAGRTRERYTAGGLAERERQGRLRIRRRPPTRRAQAQPSQRLGRGAGHRLGEPRAAFGLGLVLIVVNRLAAWSCPAARRS